MATPTDLSSSLSSIQWTNGRGLITGATLLGVMTIVLGIFGTLGTWSSSGVFTPSIPAGTVTSAMLAPGALTGIFGPTGVTTGSYGGPSSSLSATVGADGRLSALASQPIALPFSQLTGAATPAQLPYQSCPLTGCTLTGLLGLPPYTVATLPACATATRDQIAIVSDASSPTYRGALTGGGATRTLAECDGAAWLAH